MANFRFFQLVNWLFNHDERLPGTFGQQLLEPQGLVNLRHRGEDIEKRYRNEKNSGFMDDLWMIMDDLWMIMDDLWCEILI